MNTINNIRPHPTADISQIGRAAKGAQKSQPDKSKDSFDAKDVGTLKKAVKSANKRLAESSRKINFEFDKKLKRLTVSVVDTKTNKIVKEIPPAKIKALAKRMDDLIGLMVNELR